MIRRPAQIASAATIAVSAAFLLVRLENHRNRAVAPPAPAQISSAEALPNARVPDDSPATQGTPPSPAWTVAFEKWTYAPRRVEIWKVHPGNGEPSLLLKDAGQPCWSPDHKQLAFARGGNVWVAQANGNAQRQLTFWAPDQKERNGWGIQIDGISWNQQGQFLTFGRAEKFGIVLPDGRQKSVNERSLFHVSLVKTGDHPSKRFPFHQPAHVIPNDFDDSTDYSGERYPPSFDLSENRTPFRFSNSELPAWSSAGSKLAFVRNGDIWIADRSGINQTSGSPAMWDVKRIAACAEYDGTTGCGDHWNVGGSSLSWAPDGSFLVYCASRINGSGQQDFHMLRLGPNSDDDSETRRNYVDTGLSGYGRDLCVSPDSKWIIYSGRSPIVDKAGYLQRTNGIWAMTLDGKQAELIAKAGDTDGDVSYGHPVW